jgi:hypothetical protein
MSRNISRQTQTSNTQQERFSIAEGQVSTPADLVNILFSDLSPVLCAVFSVWIDLSEWDLGFFAFTNHPTWKFDQCGIFNLVTELVFKISAGCFALTVWKLANLGSIYGSETLSLG